MIGIHRRPEAAVAAALLALAAAGSLGCELVATVDRSRIPETGFGGGGSGGGTSAGGSATGGTGGASVCADGLVQGAEQCDDGNEAPGDGCGVDCVVEPGYVCTGAPSVCATVCGDGVVAGMEACDDGNLTSFDGCDAICRPDAFVEEEPNDAPAEANGPFDRPVIVRGSIAPASDVDVFAIELAATTDLSVETFDPSGVGSCANIDTVLTVIGTDGVTVLASDDDGGINACSKLGSKATPALRHLPKGTYFVQIEAYDHYKPIPGYSVTIAFDAVCCDGACDRTPICGDGFVDAPESCDDGNAQSGDGCSAACQYEVLAESEPNDTSAAASGPRAPNVLLGGAIEPASDADWFSITLPVVADLRLETFDASGPSSCVGIDTVLTLFAPDGTTPLVTRDQGGVGNCSRIDPSRDADAAARHLAPGTYFAKVESFLGSSVIPGYTLLATYAARCGDGVVEGAEACDGGPGCALTCDRVTVCGDGAVEGAEQCDDGNALNGDGCSATCQLEIALEAEPNDTAATANGPYAKHALVEGSVSPATDVDYFAIHLDHVSDLKIETFDANGPGSCEGIDTVATLYGTNGATPLAIRDGGGIGGCAKIDPKVDFGARHLSIGTYYVKIESFGGVSVVPGYRAEISLTAECGDGVVEGAEECDGAPNCTSGCNRMPVCGDGFIDAPETCDDGNTTAGDGCGATCKRESIAEMEPNGSPAEADAALAPISASTTIAGSIGPVGDVDMFRLSLAAPTVIRFETIGSSGTICPFASTVRVLDSGGIQLVADDNGGISSCSALVLALDAGTTYATVEQRGSVSTISSYLLEISFQTDLGGEAEPNDVRAQATPLSGTDVVIAGSHAVTTDTDYFAITIPPGHAIRAEVIEGSADESCESLDIDSMLTLYDAAGVAIAIDDDGGRGFCSRIDGTGPVPEAPGASALPGGTYYLAVEAAPFAQSPSDPSGQFDYRLAVTVR
jgi:cysteine-rich repeat protein